MFSHLAELSIDTLNCVIDLILRYFAEFDSFAGRLCHRGWR